MNPPRLTRAATTTERAAKSGLIALPAAGRRYDAATGALVGACAVVPGLRLRSTNRTNREHWTARKRRVDREHAAVLACLRTQCGVRCPLAPPWRVTVTRVGPRRMDRDNNVASMKAAIDAVAAWLGCDDGDEARVAWAYAQARGGYAVRVELAPRGAP